MDPVTRQVEHHIEFEPEWETAFNLQLKLQHVLTQIIAWTAAAGEDSDVLLRAFRATVTSLFIQASDDLIRFRINMDTCKHAYM